MASAASSIAAASYLLDFTLDSPPRLTLTANWFKHWSKALWFFHDKLHISLTPSSTRKVKTDLIVSKSFYIYIYINPNPNLKIKKRKVFRFCNFCCCCCCFGFVKFLIWDSKKKKKWFWIFRKLWLIDNRLWKRFWERTIVHYVYPRKY